MGHPKNSEPNPRNFRIWGGITLGPIAEFRPVPAPVKNNVLAIVKISFPCGTSKRHIPFRPRRLQMGRNQANLERRPGDAVPPPRDHVPQQYERMDCVNGVADWGRIFSKNIFFDSFLAQKRGQMLSNFNSVVRFGLRSSICIL